MSKKQIKEPIPRLFFFEANKKIKKYEKHLQSFF